MNSLPKRRLGRGLAALIGDDAADELPAADQRALRQIPIDLVRPNPNNPRHHFDDETIEELAVSIRAKGLLQPLMVRQREAGHYEIVAGERRWRAAQRAGIHEVPAIVRELSDGEALEIALIENIQRADLNPLEEARGYAQLMNEFAYTQQQLADSLGKSRSHIANTLRLLNLPESVRAHIEAGRLTAGHARTLVAADDPASLAARIIEMGLNVRQAEELTRDVSTAKRKTPKPKPEKSPDIKALEAQLGESLGLQVSIADHGEKGGTVSITYSTLEQFDEITRRLMRGGWHSP
ncbi:MAG: ParB/RepB/Spo0J family partition protein [Rhizobiales bacterium]|nr:ParB/RepB/Spo0J family partition protein [Hyphomicrobiales bacterium]